MQYLSEGISMKLFCTNIHHVIIWARLKSFQGHKSKVQVYSEVKFTFPSEGLTLSYPTYGGGIPIDSVTSSLYSINSATIEFCPQPGQVFFGVGRFWAPLA